MRIAPDEWKPIGVSTLEPEALESVKHDSNLLVIAGPGAGKTELLAQKACYLLQTNICRYPRRILAISFKKDSAANLKERVEKRIGQINVRFDSMTFDGFAKSILDNFRNLLPSEFRPTKNYQIHQATDVEIQNFFKTLNQQEITNSQLIAEIANANQLDRKKLIDNFIKKHFVSFRLGVSGRNHALDWASDQLWSALIRGDNAGSKISFQMISRLAEYAVNLNQYLRKSILATYSHVFLDEFQDTTSIQYDFVKSCFYQSSAVLTAVGDGKQRIMTWAGARTSIFSDFKNEFLAKEKNLIMNFRCAPRLVELQSTVAKHLDASAVPQMASQTTGGVIKRIDFKNESQEASSLAVKVQTTLNGGIAPEQICFLFKQQIPKNSAQIIQKLNALGIKARVEDEFQDLLKDDAVKIALSFVRYLFEIDADARDEVFKLMIDGDSSLLDYRRIESSLVALKNTAKSGDNFSSEEKISQFLGHIFTFVGNERLSVLIQGYSEENLKTSIDKFGNKFFEIYNREKNVLNSVNEFLGVGVIPCMSIHKSKGLEFDVVFFVGLESGLFWNFKNQPDEDIQAFFVAISRPRTELYITFCKQRNNEVQQKNSIQKIYDFLNSSNVEFVDLSGANG